MLEKVFKIVESNCKVPTASLNHVPKHHIMCLCITESYKSTVTFSTH